MWKIIGVIIVVLLLLLIIELIRGVWVLFSLKSKNWKRREFAISKRGFFFDDCITQLLSGILLQDEVAAVRQAAARALGWIGFGYSGNKAVLRPLLEALHDNDLNVRLEAIKALETSTNFLTEELIPTEIKVDKAISVLKEFISNNDAKEIRNSITGILKSFEKCDPLRKGFLERALEKPDCEICGGYFTATSGATRGIVGHDAIVKWILDPERKWICPKCGFTSHYQCCLDTRSYYATCKKCNSKMWTAGDIKYKLDNPHLYDE